MKCSQKAKELFLNGYNCSQAVVLAFKDYLDVDEKSLEAIASSFGGGISRLRETCGCISGMAIVLGLLNKTYDPLDNEAKSTHYANVQELALKFKEKMKSYICSDLLNIEKGPQSPIASIRDANYYHNRECAKFIEYMAELIEEKISYYGKN